MIRSGRWNELSRSAFLTVKYHNPKNLAFQHLLVRENTNNPYKNNRIEENNWMIEGIIIDTLTIVDIVEIVLCGGFILAIYEGLFCNNLGLNPYTELVTDMFEKRVLFKSQGKDLLQDLARKTGLSVYGLDSQRVMNDAIGKIGGFFSNSFYYRDTDSLYIQKKN